MGEEREAGAETGGRTATCEFDPDALKLMLVKTFRADLKAVPGVVDGIMAIIGEMGCTQGQEFEIRLSLSEALINAVEHGCRKDPRKRIQICVECDPEKGMLIVVRDPGRGFDPSQIPSPVEGRRVYRDRGRGIYLISRLMDDVRFERGGTEIRMRKKDARPKPREEGK